jgi:multidrug efflux system outer membrane protein
MVQDDTLVLVRSRQKAGFVTDLDVARAEALVAQTRASIPTLEVQVRQTVHALGVLAGEDPTALAEELAAAAPIPGVPPRVPVGMPADLLRRRPDVRRAERQAAAATARVGVATASLYPRVSITGTFGFDSTKFKHLLDRQSYYFLLSPGVSWPIFEGGRIRANVDARDAAREDALLAYREVVLGALRDVEDALVAYAAEQARRSTLAVAAQANRNAVELARQQYQQGVVDFQVVLDTQRELLAAEDGLTQSEQAIAADLVLLYKALGGGWEVEPGAVGGAAGASSGG